LIKSFLENDSFALEIDGAQVSVDVLPFVGQLMDHHFFKFSFIKNAVSVSKVGVGFGAIMSFCLFVKGLIVSVSVVKCLI